MEPEQREIRLVGIPASPGVAIGTAFHFGGRNSKIDSHPIIFEEIPLELQRFRQAIEKTKLQIKDILVNAELSEADAKIFDAHLQFVDDHTLIKEVVETVERDCIGCDFVVQSIFQRYIKAMSKVQSPYIRERRADLTDVASRIIMNIRGMEMDSLRSLPGPRVVLSHELSPSDTAMMDRKNVLALVTETGSRTSHAALIARSMKKPAVVGIEQGLSEVKAGDCVVVDGYTGVVVVNPKAETLNLYTRKESKGGEILKAMLQEGSMAPETLDGYLVELAANIELVDDIDEARNCHCQGIGLYRTEYMYMGRRELPSEEEQYLKYKECAEILRGDSVVIRTLDIGGDKLTDLFPAYNEDNPFLGLRAIRLCLSLPNLFKTQIRAILRASAHGNVKMMFPMVSCLEEVDRALELVSTAKEELTKDGLAFNPDIDLGIMIETPSAALVADTLASRVDFFSIGTNDLVQYTMAADRNNEKVAYLYQPTHPAILTLISRAAHAAKSHGIWLGVCGEMAGDPRFTAILLGLGVHELSMSPGAIGTIRSLVRKLKMHEAEDLARECMACSTGKHSLELVQHHLKKVAPVLYELVAQEAL